MIQNYCIPIIGKSLENTDILYYDKFVGDIYIRFKEFQLYIKIIYTNT